MSCGQLAQIWPCVSGTAAVEDGDAWQDVLLGTLLTLLAAPSQMLPTTPLRAAVQAVFRPICPQLTASGNTILACEVPHCRSDEGFFYFTQ